MKKIAATLPEQNDSDCHSLLLQAHKYILQSIQQGNYDEAMRHITIYIAAIRLSIKMGNVQ